MTAVRRLSFGLYISLSLCGCTQFKLAEYLPETEYNPLEYTQDAFRDDPYESEKISIQRFSNALEMQELDAVRLTTTKRFKEFALSHPDSFSDLEVLGIPTGDVEVLEIEHVTESRKRVKAAIGENKQKLTFVIELDPEINEWLVDDLFMKQKKDGVIAVRSVSDQMQLLVTVRGFMESAQEKDREKLLAHTSAEFRDILSDIPIKSFDKMREKIAGTKSMKNLKPQAQMDEEQAIVKIHRLSGQLLMTLVAEEGTWKVDDVAVESREDQYHIPSMRRTAAVMKTGLDFLKAYSANNQEVMKQICDSRFYKYVLKDADLSSFPLPVESVVDEDYRISASRNIATIVIPHGDDVLTIDLERQDSFENPDSEAEYKVTEVTLFDSANQQERQLSAVFTSQATLKAFLSALEKRDLEILKRLSTPDFNQLVWERLDGQTARTLPIEGLGTGPMRIIWSHYRGDLTEFRVQRGIDVVTYQIRDWNGEQLVDDILVSMPERPDSLKSTLALSLPLHQFVAGISQDNLIKVQTSVSGDFNRLVWKHLSTIPPVAKNTLAHYQQPLGKVQIRGEEADLELGTAQLGARVKLLREREKWLIDEIHLLSAQTPLHTAELKQTMRMQVSGGTIYGTPMYQRQPHFVTQQAPVDNGIRQIGYEVPASQPAMVPATPAPQQPVELPLDQMPRLSVPMPGSQTPSSDSPSQIEVPAEPIPAYGKLPYERRTKRINPMAPIWKQ